MLNIKLCLFRMLVLICPVVYIMWILICSLMKLLGEKIIKRCILILQNCNVDIDLYLDVIAKAKNKLKGVLYYGKIKCWTNKMILQHIKMLLSLKFNLFLS